MALASFVFAILQPIIKGDKYELDNFLFGIILWLIFMLIGIFILNRIEE